ncbi:MAG: hypothetical protein K6A42_03575 [Treponema sp.]|nr:hypothetical protein [Treponema sp.]
MKKFVFFALFLSLSLPCAFAVIETLPQDERPKQFLQFDFSQEMNRGIERKKTWGGVQYNFDWQPFGFFGGFQINSQLRDLTIRSDYLPFAGYHENGVWRFGPTTSYHMQRYSNSFREHDILQEIEARWISKRGLTFKGRTGFSLRITTFDAIKNFSISSLDFMAYAEVDKRWSNGLELFTSLGSYSLYRYPLFFCPQWAFGAAYNIKDKIRLGALLELSMTDFFASVAYFNYITLRFNVRFCF